MKRTRISREQNINLTLIRLMFVLLAVLLVTVMVHQHRTFMREREYGEAGDTDLMEQRLAELSTDMQSITLEGLSGIRSLSNIAITETEAAEGNSSLYRRQLELYLRSHTSFYFVRYIPADGTGAIEVGNTNGSPTKGEDESPFDALAMAAVGNGPGEYTFSELVMHTTATGTVVPLIYAYAPVMSDGKTLGVYEIGFDVTPLFDEVTQMRRSDETLVLLDNQGRYLVDPDGNVHIESTIYKDYPQDITNRIFGDAEEGSFVEDGVLYSFRHTMTPGVRFGISDVQYWVVLDMMPSERVFADTRTLLLDEIITMTFILLMIIGIGVLFYVLLRRNRKDLYEAA